MAWPAPRTVARTKTGARSRGGGEGIGSHLTGRPKDRPRGLRPDATVGAMAPRGPVKPPDGHRLCRTGPRRQPGVPAAAAHVVPLGPVARAGEPRPEVARP